jgi:hypothetical protein
LYPSVNTNRNIFLVYTKRITIKKKELKRAKRKNDVSFIQIELLTELTHQLNSSVNLLVIFNL